jgi:hypothetical protein
MAKPITTRTLGPPHYEDLEPHRFEDLVRALLYDFRPWRQIEATGRSGADEGFDARAWEIVPATEIVEGDDQPEPSTTDRPWLIQCKREKAIGPRKLATYLDGIGTDHAAGLNGLVMVAACDFSLKARDVFRAKIRKKGLAEGYLWGKGEIDDMLFQPKNDHLLFAFFGFSLKSRRQTVATAIRALLAAKRKLLRMIDATGVDVLIRDATDERYPYVDDNKDRFDAGRWLVRRFDGCFAGGARFLLRRCLAFLDDDGEAWDFAEKMNDAIPFNDPWKTKEDEEIREYRRTARQEAMEIWDKLPPHNRGWYELHGLIPFENVIDVDDKGDEFFEGSHVYTTSFSPESGPFRPFFPITLETVGSRWGQAEKAKRIEKFPRAPVRPAKTVPDQEQE